MHWIYCLSSDIQVRCLYRTVLNICDYIWLPKPLTIFIKRLHHRCLTGFYICYWPLLFSYMKQKNSSWNSKLRLVKKSGHENVNVGLLALLSTFKTMSTSTYFQNWTCLCQLDSRHSVLYVGSKITFKIKVFFNAKRKGSVKLFF